MLRSVSLTADDFLRRVEDALKPLVAQSAGVLDVATDPDHAIELLATAPRTWRLILGWPGFGDHPESLLGMGSHRLYAIIQIAPGLNVRPGDALHRARPGSAVTLMGLIETVSMWFRAMRFADGLGVDPKGFSLTGSAWLAVEEITTRQHQLDFSLNAALPFLPNHIIPA